MRKILLAVLSLLALIPTACTSKFSGPTTPLTPASSGPSSPGSSSVPSATPTMGTCGLTNGTPAQAINLLSGDIYAAYQSQTGNIFFSPFSIETAMSMAQEGAVGLTACQMQNALHLNGNATARQAGFQQLLGEINNPSKNYTLATANDLWPQVNYNILPSYINILQTNYFAGVTAVDYINNPTGALNAIDGAVSQQTQGYIPKLLAPADINSTTRLVLTNAIYFKGTWDLEFPVSQTTSQTFNLDTGGTESVSMMHKLLTAHVGSFNGAASVIAIPYKNSEASMYIFLPPSGGMPALENAMTGANINSWLAANSSIMAGAAFGEVSLALPKFTFSTQYHMAATLAQLGMPLAFSPGQADFSGINGLHNLYISNVVHQAYVGVDETGTTAAAATGVVIKVYTTAAQVPFLFNVDHPFIFMIVENTSNVVLFMGRVNDPLATN